MNPTLSEQQYIENLVASDKNKQEQIYAMDQEIEKIKSDLAYMMDENEKLSNDIRVAAIATRTLQKYMEHVDRMEGTTFVEAHSRGDNSWTDDEWQILSIMRERLLARIEEI